MVVDENITEIRQSYQALYHNVEIKHRKGFGVVSGCTPTDSGTSMAVDVGSGTVLFDGTEEEVASATVSLSTADADQPRKDVVYWDGTQFTVATGTPAAVSDRQPSATRFDTFTPSPPDLKNTDAVVIAEVWVPAGAADIGANDINDLRPDQDVTQATLSTQRTSNTGRLPPDTFSIEGTVSDATQLEDTYWVRVHNGVAYHALRDDAGESTSDPLKLTAVDIRDPSNPVILDYFQASVNGNGHIVEISGEVAVLSAPGQIVTVDISNPSNMTELGTIGYGGAAVNIVGNYILTTHSGLTVLDASDPANMEHIITVNSGANHPGQIQGNFAYYPGTSNGTFHVFDISDPLNTTEVASVSSTFTHVHDVTVDGTLAYTANMSSDSVSVWDIRDPTAPSEIGTVQDATNLEGVHSTFLLGDYLITSNKKTSDSNLGGIGVVDVSVPSSPTVVGEFTSTDLNQNWHMYPTGRGFFVVAAGEPSNQHTNVGIPVFNKMSARFGTAEAFQFTGRRADIGHLQASDIRSDQVSAEEIQAGERFGPPRVPTESDLPGSAEEPSVIWVEDENRWYTYTQ